VAIKAPFFLGLYNQDIVGGGRRQSVRSISAKNTELAKVPFLKKGLFITPAVGCQAGTQNL
jgi:hypothetical protein